MTSWFQTTSRFKDPTGAKRIAQFVDVLGRFPAGHLVDLGAGHGIFSRVAVELGWRVTAVDVRDVRFPSDSSVRWVVSDVREFDGYADVDVVACLGLWYHLALEDQRALAAKISPHPLILDTHVATRTLPRYHRRSRISRILEVDGWCGRLYDESGLEERPTASWGNSVSFWPSAASLERQMQDAGYEVFEQISPPYLPDRGFFVARTLGDAAARARLDEYVSRFNTVVDPDADPEPVVRSMFPTYDELTQPSANAVPPVRTAAAHLALSAKRALKRRARRLRGRLGGR